LRQWSAPMRWIERIEAYRDYLERERIKKRLAAIQEMDERQAKSGTLLQQIGINFFEGQVKNLIESMKSNSGKEGKESGQPLKLTPMAAMRFIEIGSKIERIARGTPSEIQAVAELPEETRKRMEALYAEAMESDVEIIPDTVLEQKENALESDEE